VRPPSWSCAMPFFLAICMLCMSLASAIHQGALRIEQDGEDIDLHVVALSEKGEIFSTDGRTIKLTWGGEVRGFLAEHETDDMPVNNYYNFTLINKEISYDIDLGSVGCSCNAALFFVTMPGHSQDGQIAHGDGNPFYCDANNIGGVWCWEHDTIEGNMYNMGTTPHICNAPPGDHIDSCDKIGCQTNSFKMDPKGFCPDASCKIDTRRPFKIRQSYQTNSDGKLIRISNSIEQGDSKFKWDACHDPAYLEKMTDSFAGDMKMVFQLWGDKYETMTWLDEVTGCSGDCATEATTVTFSNIAIRSLSASADADVLVV